MKECKHGQLARSCEMCDLELERDELLGLLRELRGYLMERFPLSHVDAPGHAHVVKGRWDDNGEECLCCSLWRRVNERLDADLKRLQGGRDGEGEGEERETATGQLVRALMELALDNGQDEDERSFVDPARRYCDLRNEAVRLGFFKGKPVPLETGNPET